MTVPFHVLLIAETAAEAPRIEGVLRDAKVEHRLTTVAPGQQALDLLETLDSLAQGGATGPDMIVLDFDTSDPDRSALLTAIKNHPALQSTPVIVLPPPQPKASAPPSSPKRPRADDPPYGPLLLTLVRSADDLRSEAGSGKMGNSGKS
jgi:CheY-like chemotaxis protein